MTQNIKSERVRIGMTQGELAERLNTHVNTVRAWEQGKAKPGSINLLAMTKIFCCTPDYLLGLTDERTTIGR